MWIRKKKLKEFIFNYIQEEKFNEVLIENAKTFLDEKIKDKNLLFADKWDIEKFTRECGIKAFYKIYEDMTQNLHNKACPIPELVEITFPQLKNDVQASVDEIIMTEAFIDKIIAKINSKQLTPGIKIEESK